jgi:hypothetical protein
VKDARAWTHAALFGAVWGAAEVTLGLLLKSAGVPFFGIVMGGIGLFCMVTARRLHPAVGSTLVMGLIVVFLKAFTAGGLALGSVIGIMVQAILVEAAFTATGSSVAGALLGGGLALASAPAQQFAWMLLISGPRAAAALDHAVQAARSALGLGPGSMWGILAIPVAAAGLLGVAVGAAAWRAAGRVRRRLRGDS